MAIDPSLAVPAPSPLIYYPQEAKLFEVNGVEFIPNPAIGYLHDYHKLVKLIACKKYPEIDTYRTLCQEDLWFLVYFVMGVSCANHPFWVDACREVQQGPKTNTIDLWARDHGKSTIITIGESIQDLLIDPNERIGIFSYTKDLAREFYDVVRQHFERNDFLRALFPDLVWDSPSESPQWDADGFVLKRKSVQKEASCEPWGLTQGYPTGRHFTKRIYDDIMTLDLSRSPVVIDQVKRAFVMSQNTGSREKDRHRVVGTPYHHDDVLAFAQMQKLPDGSPVYVVRKKPATHNGKADGRPVWLTPAQLEERKVDRQSFNSQQLLDPTPRDDERLPYDYIKHISHKDLPPRYHKFMVVDPAGDKVRKDGRDPDSWAMFVIGVDPYITDVGVSKVFILDGLIQKMQWHEAAKAVVDMYLRHGWIRQLGVEKVGQTTAEVHIANALRAKGRIVNEDNGMLKILYTKGRHKSDRIEGNLGPPLRHGLIHIVDSVPVEVRARLREEMDRYPMWKDDGIDALSYLWDMLKEFQFALYSEGSHRTEERKKDLWERLEEKRAKREMNKPFNWMAG